MLNRDSILSPTDHHDNPDVLYKSHFPVTLVFNMQQCAWLQIACEASYWHDGRIIAGCALGILLLQAVCGLQYDLLLENIHLSLAHNGFPLL